MKKDEIIGKKQKYVFNCAATYFKEPMVIDRAKGQYVWDIEGNQFLDFLGESSRSAWAIRIQR